MVALIQRTIGLTEQTGFDPATMDPVPNPVQRQNATLLTPPPLARGGIGGPTPDRSLQNIVGSSGIAGLGRFVDRTTDMVARIFSGIAQEVKTDDLRAADAMRVGQALEKLIA